MSSIAYMLQYRFQNVLAYFQLDVSLARKFFMNLAPSIHVMKLFLSLSLTLLTNKLVYWLL
jgi:hypothetical protein